MQHFLLHNKALTNSNYNGILFKIFQSLFQNPLNTVFCPLSLSFACLMLQGLKLFNAMCPSRQCTFNNTNKEKLICRIWLSLKFYPLAILIL